MKTLVRSFTAALAVVVLAACGTDAAPIAAKVNGSRIEKRDLDRELEAIASNKDYLAALQEASVPVQGQGKGTFDAAFVARVLTRRIYLELVHQEVVKRDLPVNAAALATARKELIDSIGNAKTLDAFPKAYRDEITYTTAEVNVLQTAMAEIDDSPAGLKRYYDAHADQFETVCASHILVATKKEADSIVKQLAAAKDKKAKFAELAAAHSTDPGSKDNGGDLGQPCPAPSTYVPAFRDAVRSQPIGAVGKPVQTQFGYHVIRVDSRTPPPPLASIEVDVRQAMVQASQSGFDDFLSEASAKADVEVNARYGRFDRSGNSAQVVPPDTPSTSQPPSAPGSPSPQPQPAP